eukprot:jgi/Mesvir1/24377/Mv11047-RA.1
MYNGEANAFAGGGFVPTQDGNVSSSPAGGGGRGGRSRNDSLLPMTVKMMSDCVVRNDEGISYDTIHNINNVTIVGRVTEANPTNVNVIYLVDDGTGVAKTKLWLEGGSDEDPQIYPPGTYVRVSGALKEFNQALEINAFRIMEITDYNEVTLHFIDCIHEYLALTKQKKIAEGGGGAHPATSTTTPVRGPAPANVAQQYHQPHTSAPAAGGAMDLPSRIMAIYNDPATFARKKDLHVKDLPDFLGRGVPMDQIRRALDHLTSEGHLYSTTDEDHLMSTSYQG